MRTQDLKYGHEAELAVMDSFHRRRYDAYIENCDFRMDVIVIVNGMKMKVEVKREDRWDTGNIIIELYQGLNGASKESGLFTTHAHLCIHTLSQMAAIYEPAPMRSFIRRVLEADPARLVAFKRADYGNRGIILPISEAMQEVEQFEKWPLADIVDGKVFRGLVERLFRKATT